MKRINVAVAALVLMATLGMAQTNEVTSVNVVGYYKATLAPSGGLTLLAVNLDAIDPTNQNLYGIFSTQLRAGSLPTSGDRVYKFNPTTSQYSIYARKSSDGLYHDTANWSGAATNPAIASGEAFWVRSASTATNYDVIVMGEVVSVLTQQTAIVTGFQLAGYPFSSDVALNETLIKDTGRKSTLPSNADRIYLWNGTTYVIYGLWTNGLWYPTTAFGGANPPATNVITLGSGFWYNAKTNMTWTETNKYAGNL